MVRLAALFFLPVAAFAQSAIQGVVVDPTGASVPDASISVTLESTGATRTVRSAPDGRYRIPALAVGTYTVRCQKEGFQRAEVPRVSKPMTAGLSTFTDMTVGLSVSPDSAEVRFCNSDCTEYYSLVFGAESVFYPKLKIDGAGTTKMTVTRTSDTSWAIVFPAKSIGRLWRRSGTLTDLGLYYYEGRVDIQRQ